MDSSVAGMCPALIKPADQNQALCIICLHNPRTDMSTTLALRSGRRGGLPRPSSIPQMMATVVEGQALSSSARPPPHARAPSALAPSASSEAPPPARPQRGLAARSMPYAAAYEGWGDGGKVQEGAY